MSASVRAPARPLEAARPRVRRPRLTVITPPAKTRTAPSTPALHAAQAQRDAALQAGDTSAMLHAEASALPLLSAAQERELARRAQGGDTAARDALICANIRLVEMWAVKLADRSNGHLESDDLIGAGVFGLFEAAKRFNASSGNRFSTYTTWWIRQAIGSYCDATETAIRVPPHQRQRRRVMLRIIAESYQTRQREPTEDEILAALNAHPNAWGRVVTRESLRQLRAATAATLSLDWSPEDDPRHPSNGEVAVDSALRFANKRQMAMAQTDAPGGDDDGLGGVLDAVVSQQVAAILQRMRDAGRITEREVCVLARRYALGERLWQIGAYLGCTRERARQLQRSGEAKLRHYLAERGITSWAQWSGEAAGEGEEE